MSIEVLLDLVLDLDLVSLLETHETDLSVLPIILDLCELLFVIVLVLGSIDYFCDLCGVVL